MTAHDGAGCVVSWFEVERSTLSQVRAEPEHNAKRWYPAALDVRDFERAQPSPSLRDDGSVEVHKLEALSVGLRPQLEASDRAIAARAQTFSFNVYLVHYRTALSEGRVEVAGAAAEVGVIERGPLVLRTRLAATVAGLAALLSFCCVSAYRAQHPWFAARGQGGLGLTLGLLAALLFGVAALGWFLAVPARTRWNTWLPTGSGAATALMAAVILLVSGPSASAARAALSARDIEQALLIADAMRTTGVALPRDESLFDEIRLAQLRVIGEVETQARLLSEPNWSAPARAQGTQVLEKATRAQAAAALSRGDYVRLARLAAATTSLVPALSQELHLQALTGEADASLQRADFARLPQLVEELAEQGAHEAEVRVRVLAEAKAKKMLEAELGLAQRAPANAALKHMDLAAYFATALRALGSPLPDEAEQRLDKRRTQAREAFEKWQHDEDARLAKETARQERAAKKTREREERQAREEQRRAERQEARAFVSSGGGGLLCNDGTLSPSCRCGGSHRGCCSWHGGVAGCQ